MSLDDLTHLLVSIIFDVLENIHVCFSLFQWPPYLAVGTRAGRLAVVGPMGQVLDAITESLNMT